MLIAQISDTHMLPPGEIAFGLVDTEASLARAVAKINESTPDLVIHTGDFAHHGAPEAYKLALDALADLNAPLFAIPGNHDDRANMRAAFAAFDWMPAGDASDDFIHYRIEAGPLAIVALDSVVPGQAGGALCKDRLAWLDGQLGEIGARPTIVALHHPPFPAGVDGFSADGLDGAEGLADILGRHGNVIRVIAGHIHRSITGLCGPAPVVVGPSASYPFAFDRTKDAPLAVAFEPPGVAMHLWRKDFGLLSHVLPLGDFRAAEPLLRDGKLLLPASTPKQ